MVNTGIRNGHQQGIAEFLTARARSATDSRLALDISVGIVAMIVAAALRPGQWLLLASTGLCLASFGIWAVIDRISMTGRRSGPIGMSLAAGRFVFSMLGVSAAVAAGFFAWVLLMGTWIS